MTFFSPIPAHTVVDRSLSDLLAHWIKEQFHLDELARRERPYIGLMAAAGTLRDGGWPIYGGDAPTAHAILEAGGFPYIIPPLPFLVGVCGARKLERVSSRDRGSLQCRVGRLGPTSSFYRSWPTARLL